MNNTRKLSLNLLAAFAFGLFGQGCDSNNQDNKASASAKTPQNTVARSVNVKHRAKNPAACASAVQACVDAYGACTLENDDSKACANNLHDCVFAALGNDSCWPDEAEKKKKKKKKDCDKNKDEKKKDDCDKDFEDSDGDFEDSDGDFEDSDGDFEDSEGDFEDKDDDFELGDEDDIPDFEECKDMNFFAQIAKNLGITLKVAACKN